jgi:RES domain-containing protein
MLIFRASRRPCAAFDPLDSSASVARDGWRYNDKRTEVLYAAGVESLAILEVVARPGWENVPDLTVAAIEVSFVHGGCVIQPHGGDDQSLERSGTDQ